LRNLSISIFCPFYLFSINPFTAAYVLFAISYNFPLISSFGIPFTAIVDICEDRSRMSARLASSRTPSWLLSESTSSREVYSEVIKF
jgi:hypothetical protein